MFVTASVNCSGHPLFTTPQEIGTVRQNRQPTVLLCTPLAVCFFRKIVQFDLFRQFTCLRESFPVNLLEPLVESRTEQGSYRFGMRTEGSLAYIPLLAMLLQPSPPPLQHCWPVHKGILSSTTQTPTLIVSHLLDPVLLYYNLYSSKNYQLCLFMLLDLILNF